MLTKNQKYSNIITICDKLSFWKFCNHYSSLQCHMICQKSLCNADLVLK